MPYSLASTENIFPVPLWRYRVAEDGLDARLLREIAKRRTREKGLPNANRLGWQSERDLFERKEPAHLHLSRLVSKVVVDTLQSLDPKLDLKSIRLVMNGWVNVNPPGGYNGPHQHTDALLSGVYYVSVPRGGSDSGGAIEFLSPHPVRQLGGLVRAAMFAERLRVQPKAGDLLLFPGQLSHWVHPNDSGEERVTIAFNAMVAAKPVS